MRDWNLRDANWHPDFRTSADEIQRFLALNGVDPVDGVLAFDQQALGILLAAIGPVQVPGHDVRVSTANAYSVLEHFAHSTGDRRAWFSARPFYAELTAALLGTTTERLRADPRSVIGAVQAMVAEKHLLAAIRIDDARAVDSGRHERIRAIDVSRLVHDVTGHRLGMQRGRFGALARNKSFFQKTLEVRPGAFWRDLERVGRRGS